MSRDKTNPTLAISILKHSFHFTTHLKYSETILMRWTGLMPYILASISLGHSEFPSITAAFSVPLVSIFDLFDLNSSCVTHVRVPLIHLLVKPRVNFSRDCILPRKRRLSCRYDL